MTRPEIEPLFPGPLANTLPMTGIKSPMKADMSLNKEPKPNLITDIVLPNILKGRHIYKHVS